MSNELELQRALRALREWNAPREPDTDLWPAIAARLEVATTQAYPRRWLPMALAASAALAIAASTIALVGLRGHPASMNPSLPTARHAPPLPNRGDPRFAAATIVLDAAEAELAQALAQDPGSRLLNNLIYRTARQRHNLDRWGTSPSSAMENRT
jgi:hypothetical protein